MPRIKIGTRVTLIPNGLPGTVVRLPKRIAGEPPLAYVKWDATGRVAFHDRRNLIIARES